MPDIPGLKKTQNKFGWCVLSNYSTTTKHNTSIQAIKSKNLHSCPNLLMVVHFECWERLFFKKASEQPFQIVLDSIIWFCLIF